MTREEIIKLYEKERDYQKSVFGEYKNNPSLNLGSFLLFLDNYLQKSKKYYVSKWTDNPPLWMLSSREFLSQGSCPSDAYEELIKIFALAGAALESYAAIDVSKWRENGIKEKWKD
jgi:small-conductance mechanosensitive channel